MLCTPADTSHGIRQFFEWNTKAKAEKNAVHKLIDDFCTSLGNIYDNLFKLKKIEKLIEKKNCLILHPVRKFLQIIHSSKKIRKEL
jgi:hypothetical protein